MEEHHLYKNVEGISIPTRIPYEVDPCPSQEKRLT
jgi:hypothetical protein